MASDHEVLEDLLLNARVEAKTSCEMADDILRAGWRPPARVVADGGEVEAIAVEWMRHIGFTAEQIADAEAHSCADTCERVGDAWDCTDQDGDSLHPVADELAASVAMANVAMETIEARGWRPPAREITTLDDLLGLPVGAVVRSSAGTIACRADLRRGVVFGDDRPFEWVRLALPATVIPIPTEEAAADA